MYDSGSNANGNWIRYTNGIMIAWGFVGGSYVCGASANMTVCSIYEIASLPITYPIAFVGNIPSVMLSGYGNTPYTETTQVYNVTITGCLYAWNTLAPGNAGTNSNSFGGSWQAIGRWKE